MAKKKRKAGPPHPAEPVDMSGISTLVQTCETCDCGTFNLHDLAAALCPGSSMLIFKSWIPLKCAICAQKMPFCTYSVDVTVVKLNQIMGLHSLAAADRLEGIGQLLGKQSNEALADFILTIRNTYKSKVIIKRPKAVIEQVGTYLSTLDGNTDLLGCEVMKFNCTDGVALFSLLTATLVGEAKD
jgi:hypothetical protein